MVLGDNKVVTIKGNVSLDAVASNTATHNPLEGRSGARSDRCCLRAHDSPLGSYTIWMAVHPWICAARLAADGFERFLLRLRVLARILAHSRHRRARARFHGGLGCRASAVAALYALGPTGWRNITPP